METFLTIAQVIVAVLLIVFILFQQRGTALGSTFGGDSGAGFYSTRRGLQKNLLWATIVCGAIFVILAVLNLII